jgi:hypothetical protein
LWKDVGTCVSLSISTKIYCTPLKSGARQALGTSPAPELASVPVGCDALREDDDRIPTLIRS